MLPQPSAPLYPLPQLKWHLKGCAERLAQSGLWQLASHELLDRLQDTKHHFTHPLEVTLGHRALPQAQALPLLDLLTSTDLPLPPQSADLIIANQALHWVSEVPQALLKLGRLLKPDGLLLASTLGAESFPELRAAFAAAGSTTPHSLPLTDVQAAGAALLKLGYAMPVTDRELITLTYPCLEELWHDLRLAGSRNLHPARQKGLMGKAQWQKMTDYYSQHYRGADGRYTLTLELIYLHAWRPHASQQKPLAPGSAVINLSEILK